MNQLLITVIVAALLILILKSYADRRAKQYTQQRYPDVWRDIAKARGGLIAALHLSLKAGLLNQKQDQYLIRYRRHIHWLKAAALLLLAFTVALGFYR
ncbi:hypothetical protein PY479_09920 [Shewanella sp. A32]|uniref:hypothetical protein n=1 Tax=Shewanella sp. A32 TaxID=3031327 RepID=UPI0023B8E25A|nr:hypothetical protein [Shewanella sp. A32]MDF0534587.1 hypothetical protein [Shewanella sp. A32]